MRKARLQPGDEFLLVACDGLWDVMTSEEAHGFVRDRLRAHGGRGEDRAVLTSIAAELVSCAIDDRRSTDNVSVLLARIVAPDADGGPAARGRGGSGGVDGDDGGLPRAAGIATKPNPDLNGSMNMLGLHKPTQAAAARKPALSAGGVNMVTALVEGPRPPPSLPPPLPFSDGLTAFSLTDNNRGQVNRWTRTRTSWIF
jgi:hypothetical protein